MKDKVAEVSHLFLINFFYSSVPPNIATLPSILQCSCAINCSDQVANISTLTDLLISILSWQIFVDKNTAKQY